MGKDGNAVMESVTPISTRKGLCMGLLMRGLLHWSTREISIISKLKRGASNIDGEGTTTITVEASDVELEADEEEEEEEKEDDASNCLRDERAPRGEDPM